MKAKTLSKVKKGEFFTFKPIEEPAPGLVYVRSVYDRSTKKVAYYPFEDVCREKFANRDRVVYVDFEF